MKLTKHRESNIELLRIVSMLIIVVYHILVHAIIPNAPELSYITKPLITVLHIGVVCFVLISGYFGIRFSLKGFMKLFLYCSFYSILIYGVGSLLNPDLFSLKNSLKSLFPLQWWFIPVYLCLYLLTPIINIPLKNASNERKILYILLLIIISFGFGQFIPTLSDGKNPINFVLIYYIGNYLSSSSGLLSKINIKKICIFYLALNTVIFLIIYFSEIYFPIMSKIGFRLFYPYNSVGLILNSAMFFLIFTRLKFSSKWINWMAGSALSIYLIHENKYIGHYLYDFVGQLQNSMENMWLFSVVVLLLAIVVLIACVLIDKLVSPVFHLVIRQITDSNLFILLEKKVINILA